MGRDHGGQNLWDTGFNPQPGQRLNFGRPSFATSSVDRGVKSLV